MPPGIRTALPVPSAFPVFPAFPAFIGRSRELEHLLQHLERVAAAPRSTVLVIGESGVGKELIARAVHAKSARSAAPFVALNCAALAEGLLEAELFGYEPGAFTGGHPQGREGLVAAAEGGTLFLDEVGELPSPAQAKLLRLLQERTYRRVGGDGDRAMDVRIVAASNRDLETMIDAGAFRADLFYRLNVLTLRVPPLRERPDDIEPLALHFLELFGSELGRAPLEITPKALCALRAHAWPGNVRELRNSLERAAILAQGSPIRPEHLDLPAAASGPAPDGKLRLTLDDWSLRGVEEALIRRVVEECDGNRSRAARELGINRTTLYKKLRSYGIAG